MDVQALLAAIFLRGQRRGFGGAFHSSVLRVQAHDFAHAPERGAHARSRSGISGRCGRMGWTMAFVLLGFSALVACVSIQRVAQAGALVHVAWAELVACDGDQHAVDSLPLEQPRCWQTADAAPGYGLDAAEPEDTEQRTLPGALVAGRPPFSAPSLSDVDRVRYIPRSAHVAQRSVSSVLPRGPPLASRSRRVPLRTQTRV